VVIFAEGGDVWIDMDMEAGDDKDYADAIRDMEWEPDFFSMVPFFRATKARGRKAIGDWVVDYMCEKEQLCGSVASGYIKNAWMDDDYSFAFFVAKDAGRTELKPVGFALVNRKVTAGEKSVYVNVIVGDSRYKMGNKIIDYVTEWSGMRLDIHTVTLSALVNVLGYYPRIGFQHRKSCKKSAYVYPTPRDVLDFGRDHPGKLPKGGDIVFDRKDPDYALYEPYRAHALNLHQMGYNVRKDRPCRDPGLTMREFAKRRCYSSGFSMRKCTKPY
jgi:hypothetical protein